MTQPDLKPSVPSTTEDANEHMHADFVSLLRFPLVEGVFDKADSRLYYDAVMQVGKLVSSVEPGTLVESNQEVWSQIRDIRNGIRRAMQNSFNVAKESKQEHVWFQRAVEHSNRVPVVTHYFTDDVLMIDRDYQPEELNFSVPPRH